MPHPKRGPMLNPELSLPEQEPAIQRLVREAEARGVTLATHIRDLLFDREAYLQGQAGDPLAATWIPRPPPPAGLTRAELDAVLREALAGLPLFQGLPVVPPAPPDDDDDEDPAAARRATNARGLLRGALGGQRRGS